MRNFAVAFEYYRRGGDIARMIEIATQPEYLHAGRPGFPDFYPAILPHLSRDSLVEARVLRSYGIAEANGAGDFRQARELLSHALSLAMRHRDLLLEKQCLAVLAVLDNTFNRFDQARSKTDAALRIARDHPDPYGDMYAWFAASSTLRMTGRFAEAMPYLDRAVAEARRLDNGDLEASLCHERAGLFALEGSWQRAREEIDRGLAIFPNHLTLLAARTFLEYTVGDYDRGDTYRERVLELHRSTPPGPYHAHIHAASTAAARARNSGETRGLAEWVPPLRSLASFVDAHPFVRVRAHLLLAFVAAQTGDEELARTEYRTVLDLPKLHLIRPYLTERFLGLAARSFGNHRRAVVHLKRAARQADDYGDRPLGAWIACELAEALLLGETREEDPDEARRLLLRALESAGKLGMEPLRARVMAKLDGLSELDLGGAPPEFHVSGREREVMRLVSEGLSNAEVAERLAISPNTVANHLRNTMAKTRTKNRTEAVHLLRSLGLID